MAKYTGFTDGACSGNPGDSGIGIVMYKDKDEIFRESKYIGVGTNNTAEYTALLTLLKVVKMHRIEEIDIFTDSELLVKQLSGEYKIKNETLRGFIDEIKVFRKDFKFTVSHIRRELNAEADELAKQGSKRGTNAKEKMG